MERNRKEIQTVKTRVVKLIRSSSGQDCIKFVARFDADLHFAYKEELSGARFESLPIWGWYLPRTSKDAQQAIEFAERHGFAVDREIKALAVTPGSYATGKELNAVDLAKPLPDGRTLFNHQQTGARLMIEKCRMINADDMGLGKTATALVAAKAFQLAYGWRVIVLAPISLKLNWMREAAGVGVRIEVYSWAKLPEPPACAYVLIADEAHYAQSLTSRRGKGFQRLAKAAKAVFPLTGTPMKNAKPLNLFPLLLAIRHPLSRDQEYFEQRYCQAKKRKIKLKKLDAKGRRIERTIYDASGASNLIELRNLTKDSILRRTKAQCLDLPQKMRVLRDVEPSELDASEYHSIVNAKRAEYEELIRAGAFAEEAQALAMINVIRQAASKVKIADNVQVAEEIIEQDQQIVLFTEFLATAHSLFDQCRQAGLKPELLTGATKTTERQALVDRFQQGKSNVFIGTIQAGGVGITLTKASTIVLVDRAWTPGDCFQAEDRVHRIGQHWPVTAIWSRFGAFDQKYDELILKKQERIDLVLEGERKTMRGVSGVDARALISTMFNEMPVTQKGRCAASGS